MEAITAYSTAITAERGEITAALFNNFVGYVDRSERTTKTYLTNLRQFMAYLKYKAIRQPQRQDVINYRNYLMVEHEAIQYAPETPEGWTYRTDKAGNVLTIICRANTAKIYLQSVKQFFRWTERAGVYPNIADNIHAPKVNKDHKKDALKPADVLAIEQSIKANAEAKEAAATASVKDKAGRIARSTEQGARLKAMYLLAVNNGLRVIELSRANIKDLETVNGQTYLYIWGKGHSEADQKKPIAPEVAKAIYDYLETRKDKKTGNSPLFVATGNRSKGQRIASTTISTMLKKAMVQAGYNSDRLTAHSLRHTTAANVMQLTHDNIYKVQGYMRHASPATTEIYLERETTAEDSIIARELYSLIHDVTAAKRSNITDLIASMTTDQAAAVRDVLNTLII